MFEPNEKGKAAQKLEYLKKNNGRDCGDYVLGMNLPSVCMHTERCLKTGMMLDANRLCYGVEEDKPCER